MSLVRFLSRVRFSASCNGGGGATTIASASAGGGAAGGMAGTAGESVDARAVLLGGFASSSSHWSINCLNGAVIGVPGFPVGETGAGALEDEAGARFGVG